VYRSAISHARLMRISTDCIEFASRSDDAKESLIARRILATPGTWHSWELEHSGLMRQLSEFSALRNQATALRHTALRLIHGKALFEYLRKHNVRGEERAQILSHFYPTRLYEHAVIAEHTLYLRKACSLMCANRVGTEVVLDGTFLDPMLQYETLYAEYFDLYCSTLRRREGVESASQRLLPLLKHQLNEWRWVILNPKRGLPHLRRETEIRRPLGDTQRMPVFKLPKPSGK
jgi:hypothetical protein